jgi:hypothetical protein
MFLWGECICSNFALSLTSLRLLGVATIGQGVIRNFGGLVAMRFLLGVFEAGLFPGKRAPATGR